MKKEIKKILPDWVLRSLKDFRRKIKFSSFKRNSVKLNKVKLVEEFKRAGFSKGDVLFIHSSLKGLGYIENGAIDVL